MTKKPPTIHCLQENLKAAISAVSHFVAERATLPVLSTILVAVEDSRLKLSATNLETALTAWVGAKIEGDLAIAVPAKTFADVVNAISGELTLTLNVRTWTLTVAGGRYHNEIKGIDPQEFPTIPRVGEGVEGLPAVSLERAIRLTAFAAETDSDARPILAAVSFSMNGDGLTLAATNGFRLSRAIVPLPNLPALKALVPARTLSSLASLLKQDDEVTVQITDNQIRFKFGAYEMISQLVEGTFPDYENIIPKKSTTSAAIAGDSFTNACKAADIFARENNHTARFAVSPGADTEPGRVTVSAQSAETGSGEAAADAVVQGDGLEIAFNVKFMLDALNAMKTKNISLGMTAPTAPAILRDPEDDNFLHVLMPMRLGK